MSANEVDKYHQHHMEVSETSGELKFAHTKARSFWHNDWSYFMYHIWASMGGWTAGLSAAVIGSSFAQPTFGKYFGASTGSNYAGHLSGAVSLYFAGALFGFYLFSYVSDRWGRRWGAAASCAFNILGSALSAGSAPSFGMFFVARFFVGFGGFSAAMVSVIYQTEISSSETRGFFGGSVGFALSCSYTTATWLGVGFYFLDNDIAWRIPFIICFAPPLFMIAGASFVPESPRWLAEKGRNEETLSVLKKMHSIKYDPGHSYANEEYQRIVRQAAIDNSLDSSWRILFTKRSLQKRILLALLASMTNQVSGIQALTNFQPTLYANLGYGTLDQLYLSAGWQTISAVMDPFMLYLLDILGRKPMILIGATNSLIFMIVETAILSKFTEQKDNIALQRAGVAFLFLELAGYMFGQAATFSYIGEIWPTHLRAKGTAVGIGTFILTQLWVTAATPFGIANIGWKFNLVYIVLEFVCIVLAYIFIIEVNQVPLEEVAAYFGDDEEVAQPVQKNKELA